MAHPDPYTVSNDVWSFLQAANKTAALAVVYSKLKTYHIETSGNDTTGDGSRAKPFATAQKAYDVGRLNTPCVLRFGVGSFGNVNTSGNDWGSTIFIQGAGSSVSAIGTITASGQSVHIRSDKSISIGTISVSGTAGTNGNAGGEGVVGDTGGGGSSAGTVTVNNAFVVQIFANGGIGGTGGDGGFTMEGYGADGGAGGDGGPAGSVYIYGSAVASVNAYGGSGGAGGNGGNGPDGSGNPGAQGNTGVNGFVQAINSHFSEIGCGNAEVGTSAYYVLNATGTVTDCGGNASNITWSSAPWL
jgi:hypothetical protein